uniref:Myelin proteolipid protein (PLP or lipophilin) n=1 Tax=Schistocephalus solidus TaxID=70667 RepID=A0A0X3PHU3_SCHSO
MARDVDVLAKIPFKSVFGFILILVGGGVTGGTLYQALAETENIFQRNFLPIQWMSYLRITELIINCSTVFLAAILLLFAVLVTNGTRGRVYRNKGCMMGGSDSASLLLSLTLLVSFCWLLFVVLLTSPNFLWLMLASVCEHELAGVYHGPGIRQPGLHVNDLPMRPEWEEEGYARRVEALNEQLAESLLTMRREALLPPRRDNSLPRRFTVGSNDAFQYIFNLTAYGLYIKPWTYPPGLNVQESITTMSRFMHFCEAVNIAGPLYMCALGGAIFILTGLALFNSALSSFRTKIQLTKELNEYKLAVSHKRSRDHLDNF